MGLDGVGARLAKRDVGVGVEDLAGAKTRMLSLAPDLAQEFEPKGAVEELGGVAGAPSEDGASGAGVGAQGVGRLVVGAGGGFRRNRDALGRVGRQGPGGHGDQVAAGAKPSQGERAQKRAARRRSSTG